MKIISFNINFESWNFSESKKIMCASSHGFSQLIKVHKFLDTNASHHETCHPLSLNWVKQSQYSHGTVIIDLYKKSSETDGDLFPGVTPTQKIHRCSSLPNLSHNLLRALNCLVPWKNQWQNFLLKAQLGQIPLNWNNHKRREVTQSLNQHCQRFTQHEHFSRSRPLHCFHISFRLTSC